ncbi:PilZ domain-containing protein [Desulfococcaceae bacterium HSG7]|nr:PilZ domain-containing protein [Desulfococcaceae bacterium HSG7]
MAKFGKSDERSDRRFLLDLPATVSVRKTSLAQKPLKLKTANISSGGAFFKTPYFLPVGTQVKIDVELAIDEVKKMKRTKALIKFSGVVIRTQENGMAVSFNKNYKITPLAWNEFIICV